MMLFIVYVVIGMISVIVFLKSFAKITKALFKVEIVEIADRFHPTITIIYKPRGFDSRVKLSFERHSGYDYYSWRCQQDGCVKTPFWLENLLEYTRKQKKIDDCNKCKLDTFNKYKVD